jgi:hypothetical protein
MLGRRRARAGRTAPQKNEQARRLPLALAGAQPTGTIGCEVNAMGKYFLGWLLGVPVFVLLLVWMFFG